MTDLLVSTASGLYCPDGDFYIDPWRPVRSAVISHAHGDHASPGSDEYLCARDGLAILQARLGQETSIRAVEYGEQLSFGAVRISLHPAGHILGSAQVRLERGGEVWVVSGDYKTAADPTCRPLEPIACDTFITESTFGLPIYHWEESAAVFAEINDWWQTNAAEGIASVIFAYSLGKAQRILCGIDASIGPIYCHGAVERMNAIYRHSGIELPTTVYAGAAGLKRDWSGSLIIAPPSARGSPWQRRFGTHATAFVSGWMQIRGARRRRSVDRGFVLSDHADWDGLLDTIQKSGARRVLVTHGFVEPLIRWLNENDWQAGPLPTEFRGELEDAAETEIDAVAEESA